MSIGTYNQYCYQNMKKNKKLTWVGEHTHTLTVSAIVSGSPTKPGS